MPSSATRRIGLGCRLLGASLFVLAGCDSQVHMAAPGDEPCSRRPVLFVHGLGQDASTFAYLVRQFESRGFPSSCLFAVSIEPEDASNVAAAEAYHAPAADRLLRAQSRALAGTCRKVHIVAHSMGALSARWFASRLRPDLVASVITTAGANHGTDWACRPRMAPGPDEMCPAFASSATESDVQLALNGTPAPDVDETPWGLGEDPPGVQSVAADSERRILYVSIRARDDPYIQPVASSLLAGAGGVALPPSALSAFEETTPGNLLARRVSGHDELLASPEVAQLIVDLAAARDGEECSGAR
jgi:pimeloyl-ACP methyl ester carboxylesterase